jgi:hypothetical protein
MERQAQHGAGTNEKTNKTFFYTQSLNNMRTSATHLPALAAKPLMVCDDKKFRTVKIFFKRTRLFAIAILMANLFFANKKAFGQTQNMYWTFNQSTTSCASNVLTTSPTNANISGDYSLTDGCSSTTTGTGTSGSPFVAVATAGNAIRNTINNSGTMKSFIFHLTGTDLPNYGSFTVYFQNIRGSNGIGGSSAIQISYSTDGVTYSSPSGLTAPSFNWQAYSATLSATYNHPSNLYIKIDVSHSGGNSTQTQDIDNFQVQGTLLCTTPTAFNITGGGSYCPGGSGVAIGLSGSQSGVNYQLYNGVTAVGPAVPGNIDGSAITFGLQTTPSTLYNVIATNTVGGCTNPMTGNATVAVYSRPIASVSDQSNITCNAAMDGKITITASGGSGGPLNDGKPYLFSVNDGASGTWVGATTGDGLSSKFTGLLPNHAYRIRVQDANGCVSK